MKDLQLYWSRGASETLRNFGDWLSPNLCEVLSGRNVIYAKPSRCDLMAIGSVLQKAKTGWWRRAIDVWGTGLIGNCEAFTSPHRFHAVRGRYTESLIKNKSVSVLGDPGLLCNILVPANIASIKTCHVGIVPHYVDQSDPLLRHLVDNIPHAKIIDVYSETTDFIRKVASCEIILSSSLHGLITADAMKVPNAWIVLSEKITGNNFKFRDYYSAFGIKEVNPFTLRSDTNIKEVQKIADDYCRPNLERIQSALMNSFPYKK